MEKNGATIIGRLLEAIEKSHDLYKALVWVWGFVPTKAKTFILHFANPSATLGVIAVITDPYAPATNPRVLLGWHSYHSRQKTPWALLGGALKRRDQDATDSAHAVIPFNAVVREVFEETGLDVEVVKLLAIDTDWNSGTMDFYFECALTQGYPEEGVRLKSPELRQIKWFRVSDLPDGVYPQHKRFLTDVLPQIPRLPGVSWTANQRPPAWWSRYRRAELAKRKLQNFALPPRRALGLLADEARTIINCEIVSIFAACPPIPILSPEDALPSEIPGSLVLLVESHDRRGLVLDPALVELPYSAPVGKKLGLTSWALRASPLGEAVRLHASWLRLHEHVKSCDDHGHLTAGTCHSFSSAAVVGGNHILGLIKAENRMKGDAESRPPKYIPFGPDDGYILEVFAEAAAPVLQHADVVP